MWIEGSLGGQEMCEHVLSGKRTGNIACRNNKFHCPIIRVLQTSLMKKKLMHSFTMHQLLFFKKRYEAWPHPNGGTEKPVSPARAAGSHSASKYMLPHFVFSWGGYGGSAAPDWRNRKTCQPCTRRRQPFCQQVHAPPFCFFMGGMGALPHPNGGTEKPASSARGVGSHSASKYMLSHFVFS